MSPPGDYVADVLEGITRPEDLPAPRLERHSRNYPRRRCPSCGRAARRFGVAHRRLHDLGDPCHGRPIDLILRQSKHRCPGCRRCFLTDASDLALPKSHFTHGTSVGHRASAVVGCPSHDQTAISWRDSQSKAGASSSSSVRHGISSPFLHGRRRRGSFHGTFPLGEDQASCRTRLSSDRARQSPSTTPCKPSLSVSPGTSQIVE